MEDYKDYHTSSKAIELKDEESNNVFGHSIIHYEIHKHRNLTNLDNKLGYLLVMKQRIIIPNSSIHEVGPTSLSSYDNYPALLVNTVDLSANNDASVQLRGIFPRTLNSSVSTTSSSNEGASQSSSNQHTTGSSSTNVNNFGVAISGGFFGDVPTGSITADYSHTWDKGNNSSHTDGSENSLHSSSSDDESMSIKDWSSYGYLDSKAVSPTWIWGQSYPWDVIQYNHSSNGEDINLPSFVQDRMMSGDIVLPPSQLSLFGLDFTMRAAWLIDFTNGVPIDEIIKINHKTSCYTASHQANDGKITATLQSTENASIAAYSSDSLSLSSYALNPITEASSGNGAAIGFTAHHFTYPPTSADTEFKIVSPANNLQVTGTGFDNVLTTSFKKPPSLTVSFKIADNTVEYSLLLMHWIGKLGGPCKLKCTINGKWTEVLHVDAIEGQGGQNNVSSLELRNADFTSINFHDFLVIGQNEIVVEIVPVDSSLANEYTLFAMAIGQA